MGVLEGQEGLCGVIDGAWGGGVESGGGVSWRFEQDQT